MLALAPWRHQINIGVVSGRYVMMNRLHHLIGGMGAGNRQYIRIRILNDITLRLQTTGDNDFAILSQCLANGFQGFFDCGIYKTAGIDNDQISTILLI